MLVFGEEYVNIDEDLPVHTRPYSLAADARRDQQLRWSGHLFPLHHLQQSHYR